MKIGVLKETFPLERRVALTPDAAGRLVKRGHEVLVELGAGDAAFYRGEAYEAVGAKLADLAEVANADLVVSVRRPSPERAGMLRQGIVIVTLLGTDSRDAIEALNR